MKVRTTLTRLRAIEGALAGEDRNLYLKFEELAECTDQTATRVTMSLPYVAWRRIMEVLERQAFNERGQQKPGHSHQVKALADIATASNAHISHPAFRDWAALGWQNDWIPGFVNRDGLYVISPEPLGNPKFLIAEPLFEIVSGEKMTRWRWWPAEDVLLARRQSERILQEETHLAFTVKRDIGRRPHLDTA